MLVSDVQQSDSVTLIFWCHIFLTFYTVHDILTASILRWFATPEELVWGHKRGYQRIRCLDAMTHAMDMNLGKLLGKLQEMVRDREAWLAGVHGSLRVRHNWATEHVCIGLAKKFVQVSPYNVTEKLQRTFWPTQFYPHHFLLEVNTRYWIYFN